MMNFGELESSLNEYFFGTKSLQEYNYHLNFCKEMSTDKKDFRRQYWTTQISKICGVGMKTALTLYEAVWLGLYGNIAVHNHESLPNFPWSALLLTEGARVLLTGYNYLARLFMKLHRDQITDCAIREQINEESEREGEEWKRWG